MINMTKVSWLTLKSLQSTKSIPFHYIEDSDSYTIFINDGGIQFYSRLLKTNPVNLDQNDFEDNYKASSNTKSFERTVIFDPSTGSSSSIHNSQLETADICNTSGVEGAISVTTSATPVRVGVSNLSNRKNLTAHNSSILVLYWGYTNTVTTSSGTPLFPNQFVSWDVGPDVTIYLIAASGSRDVRVTESS